MRTDIYWIANINSGKIGIMARPRGGDWLDDEISSLCSSNVNIIVSLLETEEISELELTDFATKCRRSNIEFISFPIKDRDVPILNWHTTKFIKQLFGKLSEGKNIVIHCRQGIGRSSIIAAATMILQGLAPDEVLAKIVEARGCNVPDTPEQRQWVMNFAKNIFEDTR